VDNAYVLDVYGLSPLISSVDNVWIQQVAPSFRCLAAGHQRILWEVIHSEVASASLFREVLHSLIHMRDDVGGARITLSTRVRSRETKRSADAADLAKQLEIVA